MNEVRTRMAPSPTGEYHIGHIRTVLYNYAYARKNHGKFVIRIEDTDRERYVQGAVDRILDVIEDYSLSWDEGPRMGGDYGPYIQSERLEIYREYAKKLVEKDHAYYCFCTKERLDQMRLEQQAKGMPSTMYDGHCKKLTRDEVRTFLNNKNPYVIRLKVPENQTISFEDVVLGKVEFNSNEVDDTVLLKSDGYPTYHLGVVIDDHLMKITHIMRGTDWLPSTPKHVLLYKAFGWEMPKIIHLPNLKEKGENKKLSKRYGSVFAIEFLKEGYLSEALLNFLMFLGWNPGGEREIYSLEEFIEVFDLSKIHKSDLVAFDRDKLLWMNGYYIRNMSDEVLFKRIEEWSEKYGITLPLKGKERQYNVKVISIIQERLKKLSEFEFLSKYFYQNPEVKNEEVIKYAGTQDKAKEIVKGFFELYSDITEKEWLSKKVDEEGHIFIQKNDYKPKEAFMTLRLVLTGESATPPIFEVMEILGREVVLDRLANFIKK